MILTRFLSSEVDLVVELYYLQPPVAVFGIEGRYAHALYSAATKKNSLEKVEKELNDFQVTSVHDCK